MKKKEKYFAIELYARLVELICFVPHCAHYIEQYTPKFFRFLKDKGKRKKWVTAIRKKEKDKQRTNTSRVCCCHFQNQNKDIGLWFSHGMLLNIFNMSLLWRKLKKWWIEEFRITLIILSVMILQNNDGITYEEGNNKSTQIIHIVQMEVENFFMTHIRNWAVEYRNEKTAKSTIWVPLYWTWWKVSLLLCWYQLSYF